MKIVKNCEICKTLNIKSETLQFEDRRHSDIFIFFNGAHCALHFDTLFGFFCEKLAELLRKNLGLRRHVVFDPEVLRQRAAHHSTRLNESNTKTLKTSRSGEWFRRYLGLYKFSKFKIIFLKI